MSLFRTDIVNLEPYKLPGQAKYNLGDNENRLINLVVSLTGGLRGCYSWRVIFLRR